MPRVPMISVKRTSVAPPAKPPKPVQPGAANAHADAWFGGAEAPAASVGFVKGSTKVEVDKVAAKSLEILELSGSLLGGSGSVGGGKGAPTARRGASASFGR